MIRSTFAMPAVIGGVSLIGLVAALAGDGWFDAVAWAALGVPAASVLWAVKVSRP